MTITIGELSDRAQAIIAELGRAVVGKRHALQLVLAGMLSDCHVLIEDYPGLAKTLMARSFARVCGLEFGRIQFTPDLMPAEVTGASIYNQVTGKMEFRPGPVFTNLLLGDEVNRAPPKTQAALLEAMAERQVTIDGITRTLVAPFLVIATENPIEYEGTYPLPEAQLDRFGLRVSLGYPTPVEEAEILDRRMTRGTEVIALEPIVGRDMFLSMQRAIEAVFAAPALVQYIVALVGATRTHPSVELGASPRASLAMLGGARAWAAMAGRDYVIPEDVKTLAGPVLGHRVALRPELWVRGNRADEVITACIESVAAPSAEEITPRL